jgi:hypothetical protein
MVSCSGSFHDLDFLGRERVKLIDQRVNLAVQPGAFVAVKILVRVALRGGKLANCCLAATIFSTNATMRSCCAFSVALEKSISP